jgi:hypothetical protein
LILSLAKRGLRLLGIGALIVVLELVDLTVHNTLGWAGYVTWPEVGHFNRDVFERQLETALPPGAPKSAVEAYLKRERVAFHYDPRPPASFYAETAFFPGVLRIEIELDQEMKVAQAKLFERYK